MIIHFQRLPTMLKFLLKNQTDIFYFFGHWANVNQQLKNQMLSGNAVSQDDIYQPKTR